MGDLLQGQVAIVTGGGGGIGREIARGLAEEGASVAITGRTAATLEESARLIESYGVKALPFPADVTDAAAMKRLVAETEAMFGPVDVFVSNAALDSALGPVWEIPNE